MLYEVTGNLLSGDYDVICHQVNCQGIMGSGLASQIKFKYPDVYDSYCNIVDYNKQTGHQSKYLLGENDICYCQNDDCIVINMFAQDYYGTDKTHTDYTAFRKCLIRLKAYLDCKAENLKVAFPYKIGCGLAGGDWNIIKAMIESFAEHVAQPVYIVRLPE